MTNYNERLEEILDNHAISYARQTIKVIRDEAKPNTVTKLNGTDTQSKQAITSLIKELVEEAKPERKPPMKMGNPTKESSDLDKMIFAKKRGHNEAIDQFEQNLLKELEEI